MKRLARWRAHWRLYPLDFVIAAALIVLMAFAGGIGAAISTFAVACLCWMGGVLHERHVGTPIEVRIGTGYAGIPDWCVSHLTLLELQRVVLLDFYDCPHCKVPLHRPSNKELVMALESWSNSGGRDWLRSIGYM